MTSDPQTGPETARPADDIQERVLKVIALTKRLPRESVTADSAFEALGIDSLDRLNILFDLESEFDIQINDEEAKKVENIHQMVAGVRQLVEAKEGDATGVAGTPASAEAVHAVGHEPAAAENERVQGTDTGASRNPASSAQ